MKKQEYPRTVVVRCYLLKEVSKLAYFINEDCISCGACADECPVNCIAEGEEKYMIDASQCIECGACADVCPVNAPKKAE